MAIPKVFVSSTCYDLQEERAQLERFISGYGFQPVLSEYSGVFYNPDEHTHDSCVKEVSHCDLFVLVISGRFGGRLKNGNGESITQAEYNEARRLKIPVFAFVKADVLSAQFYYKENQRMHDDDFAKKINYPAIEKQTDAVDIFSFIQQVQRSQKNNAIEQYSSFTDIENHLKKQWAGMFYSFLKERDETDKVSSMSSAIEKLIGSTSTLESLVESLHSKNVGEQETKALILDSETRQYALNFYSMVFKLIGRNVSYIQDPEDEDDSPSLYTEPVQITLDDIDRIVDTDTNVSWTTYLSNTSFFEVESVSNADVWGLSYRGADLFTPVHHQDIKKLKNYYEKGISPSKKEVRKDALLEACAKYLASNQD